MQGTKEITANTLQSWLETGQPVSVLDIRPIDQRTEWFIPGSVYYNAYDRLKANDRDALDGLQLDKSFPVVAVCAGGKTSMIAAEILRSKGYQAYSLQNGMKGWSLSWNTAKLHFDNFEIVQFRRTGKGCLSYMVISAGEAAVVDASLPVEVYDQALRQHNLSLKFTIDTHIHADHLSRSKQLADKYNVPLYLPAQNIVGFNFEPVTEDTVLTVANASIKPIKTPGHTLESTSYLIGDQALLTGDTLFVEGIGRPDLKADPEEANQKARLLYHSLNKLISLDQNIIVLPGHTSKPVEFNKVAIQASLDTIKKNVAMLHLSEEEFIQRILDHIPPTPPNYLAIVEKNITGDYQDINPVELEAGANRCAIS